MDYRMKLQKPKTGAFAFIGAAFIALALVFVFIIIGNNSKNIEGRGKEVRATVTSVQRIARTYEIKVKYEGDDGEFVEALLQNRGARPSLGQTIKGYVLDENPKKVYSEENKTLKTVFIIMVVAFAGLGIFIILLSKKEANRYKLLSESGITCEGIVRGITIMKDSNGKISGYAVHFEYTDTLGGVHEGDSMVYNGRQPSVGDRYPVVYAMEPKGGYIAEMIQ